METISGSILFLAIFWLVFFWNHLKDWRQATGELLAHHFPHWTWLGKGGFLRDNIYYLYPGHIPFLSSFYPLHYLTARLGKGLGLNSKFRLLNITVLSHYFLCSFLSLLALNQWFDIRTSLFGALTLTYMATNIKLHNPCIAYTVAWIPGMFIKGWFGGLSLGMALLSGYYPTLIYILPFALCFQPSIIFGFLIGLPQLIPFLFYYPNSIRWKQKPDNTIGNVPAWRFSNLLGIKWDYPVKGLGHLETEMYLGLVPLFFIFNLDWFWIPVLFFAFLANGKISPPFRNSCRFLYPMSIFLVLLSLRGSNIENMPLNQYYSILIIQIFCLWMNNRNLYPMTYQELPIKPSKAFNTELTRYLENNLKGHVSGLPFPLYAGYINNFKTCFYTGGMMSKETARVRGITNLNGQSAHDWFLTQDYSDPIIQFAYRPTFIPNDWKETPIKGLYRNVKFCSGDAIVDVKHDRHDLSS